MSQRIQQMKVRDNRRLPNVHQIYRDEDECLRQSTDDMKMKNQRVGLDLVLTHQGSLLC